MSTDLTAIDERIAELQQMRKAIVDAEKQEAALAAKQFKWDYDYSVSWPHPSQVRINRQISADCAKRLEAFRAQYPNHYMEPFVGGMLYSILDGGYIVSSSGGAVIVEFDNSTFNRRFTHEPVLIKSADLAALRRGEVPLSIRRP